ncbi:hypothetical protein BH11ACT5_BH11ACT5_02620 [soil metagenome]
MSVDPGWTPVSITTAIVAVLALFAAVGGLIQNHRQHPRPALTFEWDKESRWDPSNGHPEAEVRVFNNGSAAAKGIRVSVSSASNLSGGPWDTRQVLEVGDNMRVTVPLYDGIVGGEGGSGWFTKFEGSKYSIMRPVVSVEYADHKGAVTTKAPVYSMPPN